MQQTVIGEEIDQWRVRSLCPYSKTKYRPWCIGIEAIHHYVVSLTVFPFFETRKVYTWDGVLLKSS